MQLQTDSMNAIMLNGYQAKRARRAPHALRVGRQPSTPSEESAQEAPQHNLNGNTEDQDRAPERRSRQQPQPTAPQADAPLPPKALEPPSPVPSPTPISPIPPTLPPIRTFSPLRINTAIANISQTHLSSPPPPPSGLRTFPRSPIPAARPRTDTLPAHILPTTASPSTTTTPSPLRRIAPHTRLRARPASDTITLSRRARLQQPLPPTPWQMSVTLMDSLRMPAGATVARRPLGLAEARPAAAAAGATGWSAPFGPDDVFAGGGWVATEAGRTSEEEERRRRRLWEVGPRLFGAEVVEEVKEPGWRRVMKRFSAQ